MSINLDLRTQEYQVFSTELENIELMKKNFVFGKNGAGKSTLCRMIQKQFISEFDIFTYAGFEHILEDKKLNAVVLGEENIAVKKEIDCIEQKISVCLQKKEDLELQIKSLQWIEEYRVLEIVKNPLANLLDSYVQRYNIQLDKIDSFCISSAKELKEHSNPRITKTTYSKNDYKNDIPKAINLTIGEFKECKSILTDPKKEYIPLKDNFIEINLVSVCSEVNEILSYEVKPSIILEELKESPDKKEFAEKGLRIHQAGDNCAFCGNEVTKDRIENLKSFVSVGEIKSHLQKIESKIKELNELITRIKAFKELDKDRFYSSLNEKLLIVNDEIRAIKMHYVTSLNSYITSLKEKERRLFSSIATIEQENPIGFNTVDLKIRELIEENNNWTANISSKQKDAMEKLRLHYVASTLSKKDAYKTGWLGFEIENHELNRLDLEKDACKKRIRDELKKIAGSSIDNRKDTLFFINNELTNLLIEKEKILHQTKNTSKLISTINEKLKSSGKTNLELVLVKDSESIEHYEIRDGDDRRSIEKLSTGEKNIIGFLYFIESLSDEDKRKKPSRIILFDDPMNSNDDVMQYLIISELQKLYNDKAREKYDSKRDYFICLTHNVHFYLNVQPHGNFKESKLVDGKMRKISKYDKNGFYRIEDGFIKRITSQKDDFSTHYESLWLELWTLYEANLLNSMLNSMRRIIETYIRFNKIEPVRFYEGKEEHKKLFDVNSHSIDDHSMETVGKNKQELIEMFKALFDQNNAQAHFDTHWK